MPLKDRAASYLYPEESRSARPGTSLAFIAFGDRIEARPRSWAGYINDFELDYSFSPFFRRERTEGPMPVALGPVDDGILVQFIGSHEEVARAAEDLRVNGLQGSIYLLSRAWGPGTEWSRVELSPVADLDVEGESGTDEGMQMDALAPDASVWEIATRLTFLTQASDAQLARLFPGQVHRETYQRWRSGKLDNPTPANRRRFGLLARLFEGLAEGGIRIGEWLHNPTEFDDLTPYELLVEGRLDEVEHLAAETVQPRPARETLSQEGRPVLLEAGPPKFALRSEEPRDDPVVEAGEDWVEIEGDASADDE